MKSSFSNHDIRTWHWHCNLEFWIGACRVWKRALHIVVLEAVLELGFSGLYFLGLYIHTHIYVYIYTLYIYILVNVFICSPQCCRRI